jgi:hypothetical protein
MHRTAQNPSLRLRHLLPALLVLAALTAAPGCGRKGAPQPSIKVQPMGSSRLTANQSGSNITLSWTMPEENTDQSDLVGVAKVELFRYTELLKPKKEGEEEEAPTNYDVLDQVTQSFLAESPEDESMYGAGYGTGAMAGSEGGLGGKFGGGSSSTSQQGGSGSSRTGRGGERDGWADQQQQRAPRVTPGFRGVTGKFISARKFERNAELVHELSGSQLEETTDTRLRLFHTDPLPEMDEETLERTRYHYAIRVLDTMGREGLFSDFLTITPLEPPAAPVNLRAASLEKSIDLTWEGPPVNPWVRIARENELAALGTLTGDGPAAGTPVDPGAMKKTAAGDQAEENGDNGPPEDAIIPGWIIQPPAYVSRLAPVRLTVLWLDPWPVGPRRPVPPYIAGYYVFRQLASDEDKPSLPTHAQPLIEKTYSNNLFAFGETYRFTVRTVLVTADGRVESESSLPVTVVAQDVYPPRTPANFTYVAAAGEVTLFWTPNGEPDLLGYNIYRQSGPAETAEGEPVRLNDEPLDEPRFKDSTVEPGNRYTYHVEAVDQAEPSNNSVSSEPLQVMAR